MALVGKRSGVQLAAAYFSKSTSSRWSLAESSNVRRVVNHSTLLARGGRWTVGAARGYNRGGDDDASSLSNQIQKMQQQHQEHHMSAFQFEIEKLRTEMEKSNERFQFETQKLRNEMEKKMPRSDKCDLVEDNTAKTVIADDEKITAAYIRLLDQKLDCISTQLRSPLTWRTIWFMRNVLKNMSDKFDLVEDNTAKTAIADDEKITAGYIRLLDQKLDGIRAELENDAKWTPAGIMLKSICYLWIVWNIFH